MRVTLEAARQCHRFLAPFLVSGGRRQKWTAKEQRERRVWRRLPWRTGIIAVGYGAKSVDGQLTSQLAMKFFVTRKVDKTRLTQSQWVPEIADCTELGWGRIPTDVVELREIPAAHGVGPGSPIAHFSGTAGTMGLRVRRGAGAEIFFLSCSHVLGVSGFAQDGDEVESPIDNNATKAIHRVGTLVPGAFTKLRADIVNPCDAALATIETTVQAPPPGFPNPVQFGELTKADLTTKPVRTLTRFGAVTGVKTGSTMGVIGAFPLVNLPGFGSTPVVIDNLIPYQTSAAAGDSGAAILDESGRVIGLHVGGTSTTGFALSIRAVIDALGVRPA